MVGVKVIVVVTVMINYPTNEGLEEILDVIRGLTFKKFNKL